MAETLPPLNADDIRGPLEDPTFSVYLYVGAETDAGWDNAQLAFGLLTRLRVYLVRDIRLIQEWVGNETPKGVVFGWRDDLKRLLNQQEADDFKTVLKAIQEARD